MARLALLSILVSFLASGCVVVPGHGHGGSPAYASKHPHGGPPGQQKKVAKAKHHGHGSACGHVRKKHGGVWVYYVNGAWYRASATGWVVVQI